MTRASAVVALSQEVIVGKALEIADREGLAAVSMRRIGGELGYSGMSLYRYVANKDELLGLLIDHVMGTLPDIDDTAPWQRATVEFFAALRATLLEHPAIARLAIDRPIQGPRTQRHSVQALAVLRAGGLSDRLAVEAFIALTCYTIGAAMYAVSRAHVEDPAWVKFGSEPSDGFPPHSPLSHLGDHLATRAGEPQFISGLEHLVSGYARAIEPQADRA